MNPNELKALFRTYVDEPDQTFVTDASAQAALQQGYREFRNKVISMNPSTYQTSVTLTLSNVREYDLGLTTNPIRILGASLSGGAKRLIMLLGVRKVDAATGETVRGLHGLPSRRSLNANPDGYFLDGSVLRFPEPQTGSYAVDYVPETPTIDWAGAATTVFDDMTDWHDLIVLYATKIYMIRDGGENPMLLAQLQAREADFSNFICERDLDAPMFVNEIYHTLDEAW